MTRPACFRRAPLLVQAIAAAAVVAFAILVSTPVARAEDGGRTRAATPAREPGHGATETREVAAFRAITLRGPWQVVLRQGAREGVSLAGDPGLLPRVETRVIERDGVPTLEIGMKGPLDAAPPSRDLVATVDVVRLERVAIEGSGDVSADTLATPRLAIAIRGSGDVKVRELRADALSAQVAGSGDVAVGGRAPKLAIDIAGSGGVDTRSLDADDVRVSVAGSGDTTVTARKTLDVSIAGVGNVRYAGDPVVTSSIVGHGRVVRR